MNQSNWIGAILVIGFVAYIIANNQLPGYLDVLGLSSAASNATSNPTTTASTAVSAVGTGLSTGLAAVEGYLP
jgi:type IV secretory pathway TrbL component